MFPTLRALNIASMEKYEDKERRLEISSFEMGKDYIWVGYSTGRVYEFTYTSAGSKYVEKMKLLAISGRDLEDFITLHVKSKYARKID